MRSLMEYLDELLRYAVRVTMREELGTSRKLLTPFCRSARLKSLESHLIDDLPEPDFN